MWCRGLILFSLIWFAVQAAAASDFYIVFSTHKDQAKAQFEAAEKNAWVLITNFYPKLKPDEFAVVRGPFHTRAQAQTAFAEISKPGFAAVKEVGEFRMTTKIGGKTIAPQVLAALLGDIRLEPSSARGVANCEPNGEFTQFTPHYFRVNQGFSVDGLTLFRPSDTPLPVGVFARVNESGEIVRRRYCTQ